MLKLVLDTNVIVSALMKPGGKPENVLRTVSKRRTKLYYSEEIMSEYRRVLSYARLNLNADVVATTISDIEHLGILLTPTPSTIPLPDETDRPFYDTAVEAKAYLITGNMKHYTKEPFILTPAAFLDLLANA